MADNPNKGAKRPLLRQVELHVGQDVAELDHLDYITVFLSTEENWYKSPYGYSLAGALFARAFMRQRHPTESLHRFGQRYRVGVPMIHKHATNSGNPTLNTMEEIARRKELTLFEFLGFTPTEIRRAYRRVGLDFEAEQARAERINTHPRHVAMKREGARANTFRRRRPDLVEALGEAAPEPMAPWPPINQKRKGGTKAKDQADSDPASVEPVAVTAIPAERQPDTAHLPPAEEAPELRPEPSAEPEGAERPQKGRQRPSGKPRGARRKL